MKKFKQYGYYIIIIIVGFLDLVYGLFLFNQKTNLINNSKETDGYIDMVVNNKKNVVLHVHYFIDEQQYEGAVVTSKKNIPKDYKIKIYYNKDKPTEIRSEEINHYEYFIIILGFLFIILGLFLSVKNYKKQIEKK